jgi:hypothetical protein
MAEFKTLQAAADQIGTGALEVPVFESEIVDLVRRSSVALKRMPGTRATGHPHRYFEQTAIVSAGFTDPRNITTTPGGPTRVERAAMIKAITAQSNIGLFDKDVTEQQGQFASVVAKDVEDIVSGIVVTQGKNFWNGSDTSLTTPTTIEYVGALTQLQNGGQTAQIAVGSSIIDGLKTQVANMMANPTFDVMPTAIYANPVLLDLIDQEAKTLHRELETMEVTAGVTVAAISTQAGKLPLIPDSYIPSDTTAKYGFTAPGASQKNYYAAILTESMVERPYISGKEDNPNPRLFQLGLVGNLSGQHVGAMFNCVIVKGATYAHSLVAVTR